MMHQFRFEDMKNDSAFEKDGALIEGFPPVFDGFSPFLAILYRAK